MRTKKYWKCDACGKQFSRGSIRKVYKDDLIDKKKLLKGHLKDSWRKPQYINIEINNPGFKRKTRLCKGCQL